MNWDIVVESLRQESAFQKDAGKRAAAQEQFHMAHLRLLEASIYLTLAEAFNAGKEPKK